MNTLIVEDDLMSQKLMAIYLAPYGTCDLASSGTEAVEAYILALSEGRNFDLITLDIMIPGMNGQEVLKWIRQIEEEQGVPSARIIMTSALKDSENVMNAFKNQCDGYLPKPVERESLKRMLQDIGLVE